MNPDSSPDCHEPICIKSDPFGSYKKFLNKGSGRAFFEDTDSTSSDSTEQDNSQQNVDDKYRNAFKKQDSQAESKEGKKIKSVEIDDYHACPNTRESLGFFTWNFLHTMAIYYPEKPTDDQKNKMRNFITGFAEFYPCKVCAHHLRNDIKKMPPEVDNTEQLSVWFCKQHNIVNEFLKKPQFDCSYENLKKRWKDGYDHCKEEDHLW